MNRRSQMASSRDNIREVTSRNFGLETSHPEDFAVVFQFLHAQVDMLPLPSTPLPIHYSLIIPQVNAIFWDN
jgi:hypothetical protein